MQTLLGTSNLFYDKFHENEQYYFYLSQNKVVRIWDFTNFFNTDDCTFIFMKQGWYYICISSYFIL